MDSVKDVQKRVFQHMLDSRGKKYVWFLRALRSFKYASLSPTRGAFLETYYTLMRYIDDVVDGDAPLPKGHSSAQEYIEQKILFSKNISHPADEAECLMVHAYQLADKLGISIETETDDILTSMLFDAKRIGKQTIHSQDELEYHFHLLDIRGTIRGALKIFGEDPEKYDALAPLGMASRIFYNLRDYKEDIRAGLINIPKEDITLFSINPQNLETRLNPGVDKWFTQEAKKGIRLLNQHHANLRTTSFGLLARIAAPVVYEKPAKVYFYTVLQQQN